MTDIYTLEDIKPKYGIYFPRNVYGKIDDDIIKLFNNNEIPEDILNKCCIDNTGIYDHVCSQWYDNVIKDHLKHMEFNKKAITKQFPCAMGHRAFFHDDCESDEKINLLKKAYELDPEYDSVLKVLATELLVKSFDQNNIDADLTIEANIYLNIGLLKQEPGCINVRRKRI